MLDSTCQMARPRSGINARATLRPKSRVNPAPSEGRLYQRQTAYNGRAHGMGLCTAANRLGPTKAFRALFIRGRTRS